MVCIFLQQGYELVRWALSLSLI